MSHAQIEKQHRLFAEGKISRATYERQMAEARQRGKGSVKRKQYRGRIKTWLRDGLITEADAARRFDELERTGLIEPLPERPKEWRPSAPAAAGPALDASDEDLIAELRRRGYIVSKPL